MTYLYEHISNEETCVYHLQERNLLLPELDSSPKLKYGVGCGEMM